jgi:hypothetical protein
MEYLSQKGIEFTEKNVAYNAEAVQELMSYGLRSLPVIGVPLSLEPKRPLSLCQPHAPDGSLRSVFLS